MPPISILIIIGILLCTFISCSFAGNIYLNKIAFEATYLDCNSTPEKDALNDANSAELLQAQSAKDAAQAVQDQADANLALLNNIYNFSVPPPDTQEPPPKTPPPKTPPPVVPAPTLSQKQIEYNDACTKALKSSQISKTDATEASTAADAVLKAQKTYNDDYTALQTQPNNKALEYKVNTTDTNELTTAKTNSINANLKAKKSADTAKADLQIVIKLGAALGINVNTPDVIISAYKPPMLCNGLDETQLGFAKFSIIMFWLEFPLIIMCLYKLAPIVLIILGALLVCILVGGIYLTLFVFNAKKNYCERSYKFCYNLDTTQQNFCKLTSLFSAIFTLIIFIGVGIITVQY